MWQYLMVYAYFLISYLFHCTYLTTTTSMAARITKAAKINRRLAKHTPMSSSSSEAEMYPEESRPILVENNNSHRY